jgi:hypothetical protein
LWYVRFDILGGLSQLNIYYHSYVEKVYGSVLNIHIAAFALTSVNLLIFLLFILRPFMAKVGACCSSSYSGPQIEDLVLPVITCIHGFMRNGCAVVVVNRFAMKHEGYLSCSRSCLLRWMLKAYSHALSSKAPLVLVMMKAWMPTGEEGIIGLTIQLESALS